MGANGSNSGTLRALDKSSVEVMVCLIFFDLGANRLGSGATSPFDVLNAVDIESR